MPQLLPVGPPTEMIGGVVYALPAVKTTLYTDAVATFTQSDAEDFALTTAVTLVAGAATVSAPFIKVAATTTVTLKRD